MAVTGDRRLGSKPKVFIGSSREGLRFAYAIQANIEAATEPDVWDQGIMEVSNTVLDALVASLSTYDFAIFVFSPDDRLELRQEKYLVARDNVVFELGLFIGKLGKNRCFIVRPKEIGDFHLPSDLLGVISPTYDSNRKELRPALGPACFAMTEHIRSVLSESISSQPIAEVPPAARVFDHDPSPGQISPTIRNQAASPLYSIDQVAAVCYRETARGVEFYLVRTTTRRWIFPKGYPDGDDLAKAAKKEAEDEAGVLGTIESEPITTFTYHRTGSADDLTIAAFLLKVETIKPPKEMDRDPRWHSVDETVKALSLNRSAEDALEFSHVVRTAVKSIKDSRSRDR